MTSVGSKQTDTRSWTGPFFVVGLIAGGLGIIGLTVTFAAAGFGIDMKAAGWDILRAASVTLIMVGAVGLAAAAIMHTVATAEPASVALAPIVTMVQRVAATQDRLEDQVMGEVRALCEAVRTAMVKADAVAFVDARSEAEEGRNDSVASVTHLPVNSRSPLPRKGDHS